MSEKAKQQKQKEQTNSRRVLKNKVHKALLQRYSCDCSQRLRQSKSSDLLFEDLFKMQNFWPQTFHSYFIFKIILSKTSYL